MESSTSCLFGHSPRNCIFKFCFGVIGQFVPKTPSCHEILDTMPVPECVKDLNALEIKKEPMNLNKPIHKREPK